MKRPIKERFEEKFQRRGEENCWEWLAGKWPSGYGAFSISNRNHISSRVSYQLYVGDIPKGMHVLHKCDNPGCVNPKHLFLGTPLDNALDRNRKGRQAYGQRNGNSKLTDTEILEIMMDEESLHKDLAKKYGVSRTVITRIKGKKLWSCHR
jgi:hypothetical protein